MNPYPYTFTTVPIVDIQTNNITYKIILGEKLRIGNSSVVSLGEGKHGVS